METYLSEAAACYATRQRARSKHVAYVDVPGVREVGGRLSREHEMVAVEVKLWADQFTKLPGQALGYSLFAHRTYLAVWMRNEESFRAEDKDVANRLGVGLMELSGWKKKRCTEVLTSSYPERGPALHKE